MPDSQNSWSLYLGKYGAFVLRLHVSLPVVWLVGLLVSAMDSSIPRDTVIWGAVVLTASALTRELLRAAAVAHVGGQPITVVLAPVGNSSRYQLPADPPAHLAAAFFGCVPHALLVLAGVLWLTVMGDGQALRFLHRPLSPDIHHLASTPLLVAQLVVWINWCVLLVNLLPVEPCDGAAILRSLLWPMLGRSAAGMAVVHFAHGMALVSALVALVVYKTPSPASGIPYWFPLTLLSVVLLFSSASPDRERRHDSGLAIDELDPDKYRWHKPDWDTEEETPVLVEQHIQEKQEEALNRKRREREAYEDKRVDAILARLSQTTFDELSEEDRAILKKASRRYRKRRLGPREDGAL